MRKILITLCLFFQFSSSINAQMVEWGHIFEVHSKRATAGFPTNTQTTADGSILMPVVEDNTLKVYKINVQGNIEDELFINDRSGIISDLIQVGEDFAMVFNKFPQESGSTYVFVQISSDLTLLKEIELEFPKEGLFHFSKTFTSENEEIYFSGYTVDTYYIWVLTSEQTLEMVYSGPVQTLTDKIYLIGDGDVIIGLKEIDRYLIRRVSLNSGFLIWERIFETSQQFTLDYTLEMNDDFLMLGALEREWVGGEQQDLLYLRIMDLNNGEVINFKRFSFENKCIESISDIKYNPVHSKVYIAFANCFPDPNISLIAIDEDLELAHFQTVSIVRDLETLPLPIAHIFIRSDGDLIFANRNYKNSIEKGNLQLRKISSVLEMEDPVDLNFSPKNYSEYLVDLSFANDSEVIITGFIPDEDPTISWEQLQYFIARINFEGVASILQTSRVALQIFPNPVRDILNCQMREKVVKTRVLNSLGMVQGCINSTVPQIDVSCLEQGVYLLEVITEQGDKGIIKFIKE